MSGNTRRRDIKLGNLGELGQLDPAAIPITEFAYLSEGLPVESNVLQREYGLIIDPLQVKPTGNSGAGRVTSLVRSQTVEEFLYATHIGVVVVPDPKLFALNGVDTQLPANPTETPQFDGFVPPGGIVNGPNGAVDETARPAQFVWGHDTFQAAWALLNAYDLRMQVGSRFEIFRELAANVGACVSGGMRGFSNTQLSPVPYIRSQNALMESRGSSRAFLPKTVTAAQGQGAPTPAEPPLVNVSYGGTQLKGAFGGWYPLNGLLLAPGLPINILLERTAGDEGLTSYHQRMINSLGNTQDSVQTYSTKFTENVVGNVGFAGAKIWKAGLFRVGILIRGFALAPLACYQAYQDMSRYFDSLQKATMYRDSASMLMAMVPDLLKSSGGAIAREARVGNETLESYLQKHGNKLGSIDEVDNIDFSRLALPAPLEPTLHHHLEGRRAGKAPAPFVFQPCKEIHGQHLQHPDVSGARGCGEQPEARLLACPARNGRKTPRLSDDGAHVHERYDGAARGNVLPHDSGRRFRGRGRSLHRPTPGFCRGEHLQGAERLLQRAPERCLGQAGSGGRTPRAEVHVEPAVHPAGDHRSQRQQLREEHHLRPRFGAAIQPERACGPNSSTHLPGQRASCPPGYLVRWVVPGVSGLLRQR